MLIIGGGFGGRRAAGHLRALAVGRRAFRRVLHRCDEQLSDEMEAGIADPRIIHSYEDAHPADHGRRSLQIGGDGKGAFFR